MTAMILSTEPLIRLGFFAGVFALMAAWEMLAPRRPQTVGRTWRWPNNLGVVVVDTLVVRFFFPTAAVGLAILGEQRGWGLLNNVALPAWLKIVLAVVVLDLLIYFQHVLFHAVPALWRLHRMHHADLEFDVTTGVRFHPVEVLISMVIKLGAVAALGASALGVLAFEVLLNATSMFITATCVCPSILMARYAGWWLRLKYTEYITQSSSARPTATSGSTCLGGIGYSALTELSLKPAMRA
jgi:sterol desaturase/sphingolipid hydroxylase (fatty acid hydroxylase superfamily)